MAEKLTFGDEASIQRRKNVEAARKPIKYMHALHGQKFSQACAGCKWFVTRYGYGKATHQCLQFAIDAQMSARWFPKWAACGKHEPMERLNAS